MSKSKEMHSRCNCSPTAADETKDADNETLLIMERFRCFYQGKLKDIENEGGGESLELKIKVQEKWIQDLTEQTEMMAKIVKELEVEATERVQMLEEKLKQSSKTAYEEQEREEMNRKIEELAAKLDKAKMKLAAYDETSKLESRRRDSELNKKNDEICQLKCICTDLETELEDTRGRADNLQKAGSKMVNKSELKKLRQQKRCYEHVVDCFKQEMTVMSEQLVHLQEILNLSSKSSKEESSQLHNTLADLQELNERLKRELIETEQKVLVENQMNQIKDAQIGELQQIIGQKNIDLNMHDEAIHEIKQRMENVTIENHELQSKVVGFQTTIAQLQLALQSKECDRVVKVETHEAFVSRKNISAIEEDLHRKSQKLTRIEADYRAQEEMLVAAQKELDRVKEKTREKCKCFKAANENLQEKLAKYEAHNRQLKEDLSRIKNKTTHLAQRECCREQELSQYKQIVIELRQTLIEINQNLAVADLDHLAFDENICPAKQTSQTGDIYSTCRCEINLYKKLIENFKVALIQATQKVVDLGGQNNKLNEELKQNDMKIAEMQRKLSKKEKETCEHVKELVEKLDESKAEEKRLTDFVDKLRTEIQRKIDEHVNIKAQEEDVASTQEEIASLKGEIKKMIQNQYSLNAENDKLLNQITRLQGIISPLEEANRMFRERLDKAVAEIQYLKEVNRTVLLERDKLTNEMQALSANYHKLEKTHKCVQESARNLEMELADARNVRDDIRTESKHVVDNVKAWLEEQRRINDHVKRRAQGYCVAAEKLQRETEIRLNLQNNENREGCPVNSPCSAGAKNRKNVGFRVNSPPPPHQDYNWKLGSQGTGSLNDRDSPSSFLTCSVEEWYSPNYRDEDDTDYNDDGFVERIEALTVQMRESNKKWKTAGRCPGDCDKK